MSFDEILGAINTAKQRIVNEKPIRIGLIVGFGRGHGNLAVEIAQKAADARKDGIVGIDLNDYFHLWENVDTIKSS